MRKYTGYEALEQALTLIKTELAGKQDKMQEITAEETQQKWDALVAADEE